MKSPKAKGSAGEREANGILMGWAAELGHTIICERNLEQVRSGGADVAFTPDIGIEVEVKRHESPYVNGFWKQVTKAADNTGKIPVLMWRQNRKPWRFKVRATVASYDDEGDGRTQYLDVEMDREEFKKWFQMHLFMKLGLGKSN